MTTSTVDKAEDLSLERLFTEYEAQGYQVKLHPCSSDLPEFLADFEPDLIAFGDGEHVVVEVKQREELTRASAQSLELVLENRPGWRYELIIDRRAVEVQQTLSYPEIRAALDEALELQQRDHLTAALLLIWAATESAMRLLATREAVELESLESSYVVNRLYTLGLIGREQYWVLDKAMHLRSQAAHGFKVSIRSEDLAGISSFLRELLSEIEVQAA